MEIPKTVPAIDRARKLVVRIDDPERRDRCLALVDAAGAWAQEDDVELQADFGPTHAALIVGCNQFLRVMRGDDGGLIELPKEADKAAVEAAGFEAADPEGAIFRMFGWFRIDPTIGGADALFPALRSAYVAARAKDAPA